MPPPPLEPETVLLILWAGIMCVIMGMCLAAAMWEFVDDVIRGWSQRERRQ